MTPFRIVALSAGLMLLATGSAVLAHHSFEGVFDASRALNLRGVVTRVESVNPHSYIFLDVRTARGGLERWALEGPAPRIAQRRGLSLDMVKVGDELGVCGYAARDDQPYRTEPGTGVAVRKLSAAVLVMPTGEARLWENYGQGKCTIDTRWLPPDMTSRGGK